MNLENKNLNFPQTFIQNIEDASVQADQQRNEKLVIESYNNIRKVCEEFRDRSKYQFEILPDGRERIYSPEHGEFFIECLRDPNSLKIEKIKEFMTEFDPKETDPDMIANNVHDENYGYYIVENNKGDIVGWSQCASVKFLPKDQTEGFPPKSILYNGHTFVREDMRRKGLGREMMLATFREFGERVKQQRRILTGIVGECLFSSEQFWNNLGSKRIYFEDNIGDFSEVSYQQPPIDWYDKEKGIPRNPETGEASTVEQCSIHEHLMIRRFDGEQQISVEDLMKIIRTVYEDSYEGKEFDGDRDWPEIQAVLKNIQDDLENQLKEAKNRKLQLLDIQERKDLEIALRRKGRVFYHLITEREQAKEAREK